MTENFERQLWTKNYSRETNEFSELSLDAILASAMINSQFIRLIGIFNWIMYGFNPKADEDLMDMLIKTNIIPFSIRKRSRTMNQLTFDEYVTLSTTYNKLSHGHRGFITICSKQLTITFEPFHECSIYIKTDERIHLFNDINMNKLDIILQLLCWIRGIDILRFPSTTDDCDDSIHFPFLIYRKILECINHDKLLIDKQAMYFKLNSGFYLLRWGRYGVNVISTIIMIINDYIIEKLLYNEKLLNVTLQPKLNLVNKFQVLTIRNSLFFSDRRESRYQFHLMLRLKTPKMVNNGVNDLDLSQITIDKRNHSSLPILIQRLPVELRWKIMKSDKSIIENNCECTGIKCLMIRHNEICKRNSLLIDPKINLMFPISWRTVHSHEGYDFTELYVVFTTNVSSGKKYGEQTINGYEILNLKDYHSEVKIMNRCHLQANVYDMNSKTLQSLKVMENELNSSHVTRVGQTEEMDNPFQTYGTPFNQTKIKCLCENDFVPEIKNTKKHYLLFN